MLPTNCLQTITVGREKCYVRACLWARLPTWPGVRGLLFQAPSSLAWAIAVVSKWYFCPHPLTVHPQDSRVFLLKHKSGHVTQLRTLHGSRQTQSQTSHWPTKLCTNGYLFKFICCYFPPCSFSSSHTGLLAVPRKSQTCLLHALHLFPQISAWLAPSSPLSLLHCHLGEAFPDHPIYSCSSCPQIHSAPFPAFSLFIILTF